MAACIVVGVEGSERSEDALALARLLARTTGAELLLVNAYPFDESAGGVSDPEYLHYVRHESTTVLHGHEERLAAAGVRVRTESVPTFSPARALHEAAERERAAAMVLGPTHRGHAGRVATGSVAERLLSGAPCPVAVAPAGYAQAPEDVMLSRVGVAFVNTPAGHSALRSAAALARRAGAELEVVAVADPHVVARDAHRGRAGIDELVGAQRENLGRAVDTAVAELGAPVTVAVRVVAGRPAEALTAASHHLDALVCGSRDYGPASGVL